MLYLEVVKEELLYSERTESWGTAGNLPGKSAKPHMRISRLPLKTPSFLSCSHSLVVPLSLTYNTHTVTHMQRSQMYAWMHALRQQTLVQAQTCTLECQVCVDAVITQTEKKKFRRTSLRLWKECWSFSFSPPVTHSSPFCCSTLNPPFRLFLQQGGSGFWTPYFLPYIFMTSVHVRNSKNSYFLGSAACLTRWHWCLQKALQILTINPPALPRWLQMLSLDLVDSLGMLNL